MQPLYESIFMVVSTGKDIHPFFPWMKKKVKIWGTCICIEYKKEKYLLTCQHVVIFHDVIIVNTPWGKFQSEVLLEDEICDLALLKLPAEIAKKAVPIKIGIAVSGDTVYALGFPLNFRGISITRGIISRMTKFRYLTNYKGLVFQMDSAIEHGSSGGALLNISNELVGITFAGIDSAESFFFSIPFFLINNFISHLKTGIKYYRLQCEWQTMNLEMEKYYGPGRVLLLENEKPFSEIEGIPIKNGNQIDYADFLKFYGYGDVKTSEQISFHYLVSIIGKASVNCGGYKCKTEEIYRERYEPKYIQYGGYIFIPLVPYIKEKIGTKNNGFYISDIFETKNNMSNFSFRGSFVSQINGEPANFDNFYKLAKKKVNIFSFHNTKRKMFVNHQQAEIDTKFVNKRLIS